MAFGQPLPPTDVNLPSAAPLAQAMSTPPSLPPIAAAVQQKHGINWLGVLADALSGAVGRQGPYAEMMMQKRQQDIEDQRSQMQSDRELQRQKELYQYQLEHPRPDQPSETERMMSRYLDPSTPPDEKALIGQQLIKPQAVTVTNPDGSQEMRFIYPGQGQAPAKPVGKLTPIGGQSGASPTGGFR
jgi:hypothetical protein